MGEEFKREMLEEVARREAEAEAARAAMRDEFVASAERLAKVMPETFFTLASQVRDAVQRFNRNAAVEKRLGWSESAALTARDNDFNHDFHCRLWRAGAEVILALLVLNRSGRADAFLIEASGQLRDDRFLLRIEGFQRKSEIVYRMSVDYRQLVCELSALPERLVMAAVKADREYLFKEAKIPA